MTVKSIGSGGGRDYANIADWEAACPANLVTSADTWIGELYNDSEFVVTSTISIAGITTSADYYIELRPASGQAFNDHPDKLTNALRYNASNGVAIRSSIPYYHTLAISTKYTRLTDLQIKSTVSRGAVTMIREADYGIINRCILEGWGSQGALSLGGTNTIAINCLAISIATHGGAHGISFDQGSTAPMEALFCTAVYPSNLSATGDGKAFYEVYATATVKNSAGFGFRGGSSGGIYANKPTGDYVATDDSLFDGTNLLQNKVYADQFESVLSPSYDFRVKAGSDLIGAGVPDARTGGFDILKQTRSATAPTIGAFEFIAGGGGPVAYEDSLILGVSSGLSGGGSATAAGALAIGAAAGTGLSPQAAASGALALGMQSGLSSSGAASVSGAIGLAFDAGLGLGGQASAADLAALALGFGLGVGTGGAFTDSLTLGIASGLSNTGSAGAAAGLTIGTAAGLSASGLATALSALSLGVGIGISNSDGATQHYADGIQLSQGLALQAASVAQGSDAITLSYTTRVEVAGQGAAVAVISLSLSAGLQQQATANVMDAISIGAAIGQAIAAVMGGLVPPASRTFTVSADGRSAGVGADDRTIKVSIDLRRYDA